jgi:hypothetical protein
MSDTKINLACALRNLYLKCMLNYVPKQHKKKRRAKPPNTHTHTHKRKRNHINFFLLLIVELNLPVHPLINPFLFHFHYTVSDPYSGPFFFLCGCICVSVRLKWVLWKLNNRDEKIKWNNGVFKQYFGAFDKFCSLTWQPP